MEEFEPRKKVKIFTKEFFIKYSYVFILAIVLFIGTSYSLTFFSQKLTISSGSITTSEVDITYSDTSINASGLTIPSSDKEGLLEYVKTLTITNNNSTDGNVVVGFVSSSGIAYNDLRYALVINGAIQIIDDVNNNGLLLDTPIMGNEVLNIEIRLWPKSTYTGNQSSFVGRIYIDTMHNGFKASNRTDLTNAYVNFNCNGNNCETWRIVGIQGGRLVLTRDADLNGATERVDSGLFNPNLLFNDDSMITSVSTDNKNVYLAKTVIIDGGKGTQASPYHLSVGLIREPDKKIIGTITYKNGNDTVGTQYLYYNETNYISQVLDDYRFIEWTDGTNDYEYGDVVTFTQNTVLTAKMIPTLRNKVLSLCNDSNVTYVEKYDSIKRGAAIDTPTGTETGDVCYYTSSDSSDLAGQNGNVIFGDYCWQIVRTTTDGGVKLIYNGPKTNDNKCPNDNSLRPSSLGVSGSVGNKLTTISGNKIYGSSFEIIEEGGVNKFQLKNTFTANWNGDYDNDGNLDYVDIIGNYVCGTSSSPTGDTNKCEVMYYVGHYQSATEASTEMYTIGTNAHYSQIGTSVFNAYFDSLSLAGYMFNDNYTLKNEEVTPTSVPIINRQTVNDSISYYYGDSVNWDGTNYNLLSGGVTPTTRTLWSDIKNNVAGKYTCKSGGTGTSCATVYYAVAGEDGYLFSVALSNNETYEKTIKFNMAEEYTVDDNTGNYILTTPTEYTISLKDWYTDYTNYANKYMCSDYTSSTCSELLYVGTTSKYQISYNSSASVSYIYANDVSYTNGEYKLVLDNVDKPYQKIWDFYKNYSTLSNMHYTCLGNYNSSTNSCGGSIYFIYYANSTRLVYIELKNGEKVENALQKMINVNNSSSSQINKYNSAFKGVIDSWYESNLSTLSSYLDDDAVFCNNRVVGNIGGWGPTANIGSYLYYKNVIDDPIKTTASLTCLNVTDRFSKNNTNVAKLTYPIGFLIDEERALMQENYAKTGQIYWLGTPLDNTGDYVYSRSVDTTGGRHYNNVRQLAGVRPVVVLKPGVEIEENGNGTYNSPYIVKIN